MQRAVRTTAAGSLLSILAAVGTAVLTGCSGNDVMATIGMPTSQTSAPTGSGVPPAPGGQPNALVVTDRQRDYLDALAVAGVKPSSDLLALSIGSYVCQARAAKHNDQAVWDIVYPLVRGEVNDRLSAAVPSDVDAVTSDYIRIATARLC